MTRDEVRAIDRWAIETLGVPGLVLMENAGRSAADAAGLMLAETANPASRVAVLAGGGNNAGDGFVVARHLRLRGIAADTYLLAPREKIRGDALVNLEVLEKLTDDIHYVGGRSIGQLADIWQGYGLLVDAIGGTGINGPLLGDLAAAVSVANAAGVPILAIDIPTGLDCDTGQALGPAIRAATTITFVARKRGFDAPGAADYTGKVIVADIGVPIPEPLTAGGQEAADFLGP
ncbi:MAG: NAD(P)H-hydrate epimerase [Planctomycetes bacterium]|nr:NAD(P)H-hydrate epimerase [Planctomycetota bacterium]